MSDFLDRLLCLRAADRCSAAEALRHPWLAKVNCSTPFPTDGPDISDEE